jgi:hypothetical protein
MINSRRMRLASLCSTNGGKGMYIGGKPKGKRPLGRPRRRWVDNIKIDVTEIGWDGMD